MQTKNILFILLMAFPLVAMAETNEIKRLSLVAEAAVGFNTNPTLENTSTSTQPQQSGQGKGKSQNSLLNKADLETQFSGKAHYKAIKTDSFTLSSNYEVWGDSFVKNSEENFISHEFSAPLNFYSEKYRLELIPTYIYQTLSGSSYLANTGVEGRLTSRFSTCDLRLITSYAKINALDDYYSYMSGDIVSAGGEVEIPFGVESNFLFSIVGTQSNNNDKAGNVASYSGVSVIPNYSFSVGEWNFSSSLGYIQKTYSRDIADNSQRIDELKFVRVKPAYFVSKNISVFLDLKYSSNDSSATAYDYDQFVSLIGFTWFAF